MNSPIFHHPSMAPPSIFYPTHHHHHSQSLNTSASQNILRPTMTYPNDIYQKRNNNCVTFRNSQAQSTILYAQNQPNDNSRRLILDSFGRKVSYHEYNVGQSSSTAQKTANKRLQRIETSNNPQSIYSFIKTIKKPMYTSQILTNQNNVWDSNGKQIQNFDQKQNKGLDLKNNIINSLYESIEPESHHDAVIISESNTPRNISYNLHEYNKCNSRMMKPLKDSAIFLNAKPNSPHNIVNSINLKLGHSYIDASQKYRPNNQTNTFRTQNDHQSSNLSYQLINKQKITQKKQNIKSPFEFRKKKTDNATNTNLNNSIFNKKMSLNDFQLLDKIGKGSFGDVYISKQKVTGFICVIKKLLKKKIIQMKLQQHLLRQIKIQSFLKHRHLTSLYGFFHDESHIYLILEIMPDGSLMQVKKKKIIPQSQVSNYLKQICQGLKYMHTQQIIHRDIKPQNIFLHEGYAKIGDFGCSIYTHSLRNTVVGSLAYISPEQLQQGFYDEKIDVWSLGVMAYEMLLGKSPYQQDIVKIARQEISPTLSRLKFPPQIQISQEAKDFILSTLHLDSNHRIGIVQALKHPFIRKYDKKDQFLFDQSRY